MPEQKCSMCGAHLMAGPLAEYETLSEHVTNPNQETYPMRPTYWCQNIDCRSQGTGFFDYYGDFYPLPPESSLLARAHKDGLTRPPKPEETY